MANLTDNNCSVDKNSGAVFFHKSPELKEILTLKKEVKNLNEKLDRILQILSEK